MGASREPPADEGALRHVLVVTPWYPTDRDPVSGTFVRDHVAAVSGRVRPTVLRLQDPFVRAPTRRAHTTAVAHPDPWPVYETWGDARFGIAGTTLAMGRALRRVRREEGDIDLMHAHVWSAAFICSLFNRRRSIPLVVTEHSTALLRNEPAALRGRSLRAARIAYSRADAVIAVGSHLADELAHMGATNTDVSVVGNPVDPTVFGLGTGGRAVVGIGALEPRKGFDLLVEAFGLLKHRRRDLPHTLRIVGDGSEAARLRALVDRLAVRDVEFLGRRSKPEISRLLGESDAHVSTSRAETFGVTLVESLFAGTPVVATSSGGPRDIVGPGDGCLLASRQPAEIADAMEALLDARESHADRRARRDRAVARFSCEAVAARVLGTYGAAERHHRRRSA